MRNEELHTDPAAGGYFAAGGGGGVHHALVPPTHARPVARATGLVFYSSRLMTTVDIY